MSKFIDFFKNLGKELKVAKKNPELSSEVKDVEKSQAELQEQIQVTADQVDKKGNSKAAEKLREIAERLKKAPSDAVKKLEEFFKREKLPSKNKKDMQFSLEKFKTKSKKLLDSINVKKKHTKHVEAVVLGFYQEVSKILGEKDNFLFYGFDLYHLLAYVNEGNFINRILSVIKKDGLENYSTKHKISSVYKWYKYLLKVLEEINQELLTSSLNSNKLVNDDDIDSVKTRLISGLCTTQEEMYGKLCELLNLKEYVDSHKIKKSSLGKVAYGDKYRGYFSVIEENIKEYRKDSWAKYAEVVDLKPPKYQG